MCSADGFLVLFGQQVFLLGADEVGAVDGEKILSLAHVLVRRIGEDIPNPSWKARLHIREPLLVDRNAARSLKFIAYFFHLHDSGCDADFLHALRRHLNWRESRLFRLGSLSFARRRRFGKVFQGLAPQRGQHRSGEATGVV